MREKQIYEQRLADLSHAYRAQLKSSHDELQKVVAELVSKDRDPAVYGDLNHVAHKLAGSASVFGFSDVSAAAEKTEALLALAMNPDASDMQTSKAEGAVKNLIECIEDTLAGTDDPSP